MDGGWEGEGFSGVGSVHPSVKGSSLVKLRDGVSAAFSWRGIEFREEVGEGSGGVGSWERDGGGMGMVRSESRGDCPSGFGRSVVGS